MTLTKQQYQQLATLRHTLRRFVNFSQNAAELEGLKPQQHQALLAIKGFRGEGAISIGELAEHLFIRHHSAVGLIDRLVRLKLVLRMASGADRRRVELKLSASGERLINRLASTHWLELQQVGPELRNALDGILEGAPKS